MTGYWDNSGPKPDLSKVPAHLRQELTIPIPVRPDECYIPFVMFKRTPALIHPNARFNVSRFTREPSSIVAVESGIQMDFADFTGRIPLATCVIPKDAIAKALEGMVRAYTALGGDMAPIIAAATTTRTQEERIAFFEERNDE